MTIYEKKIKEEDEERRKRIRENADKSFRKAAMPPTMQKWADRKKQEPSKLVQEEYSFMPQRGPDFSAAKMKKKQDRFNAELAKNRESKKVVVARSPNFQKRPTKLLDKPFVDEGNRPVPLDTHTLMFKKLAEKFRQQANAADGESTQKAPKSTKAVMKGAQKRREEINEKMKKDAKDTKEREERDKRLGQKRPASELLGPARKVNKELAMLKTTIK